METDSRLCKPSGDLTNFEAAEFKESLLAVLANDGLVCLDLSRLTSPWCLVYRVSSIM